MTIKQPELKKVAVWQLWLKSLYLENDRNEILLSSPWQLFVEKCQFVNCRIVHDGQPASCFTHKFVEANERDRLPRCIICVSLFSQLELRDAAMHKCRYTKTASRGSSGLAQEEVRQTVFFVTLKTFHCDVPRVQCELFCDPLIASFVV